MPTANLSQLAAGLQPWTQALLEVLTDRERTAVILRETAMTLEQIGVELDVSARRANQVVEHGTEKLVNGARQRVLLHRRVLAASCQPPSSTLRRPTRADAPTAVAGDSGD